MPAIKAYTITLLTLSNQKVFSLDVDGTSIKDVKQLAVRMEDDTVKALNMH